MLLRCNNQAMNTRSWDTGSPAHPRIVITCERERSFDLNDGLRFGVAAHHLTSLDPEPLACGRQMMATKHSQDQLNEIQRKNLEAAMRLAQLSIENSQRLMELQVETAKSLFEEGVSNAKALSSVKDPQELIELRTRFAQSSAERMLACAREMAEMTSRAQAEVGKLVGQQLATGGQDVFEAMQKMFQGMPVTDQNAMTAIQTAMDTTRAAFEQMTKASTEAFQMFNQAAGTKGRK